MKNIAESVLARLKNEAKKRSISLESTVAEKIDAI